MFDCELENNKKVKRVLLIIMCMNLFVAILKVLLGLAMNSNSTLSDGFHSIGDGASNIVCLVGLAMISKASKSKEFPYGHSKLEVITGLFIGSMLFVLGIKIVINALGVFVNPVAPNIDVVSMLVLGFSLIINIFVCNYEYKMGKKLNSYMLIADSEHTKSDIFISIGVILALIGIKLGLPPMIDPIISIVVACFILHSSYEILKPSIYILIDRAILDEKDIIIILNEFDEIKGYHHIRSRGSEANIHVDMHVLVDKEMRVDEAHTLSHAIEDRVRDITNSNTQVIVHIEPYYQRKL